MTLMAETPGKRFTLPGNGLLGPHHEIRPGEVTRGKVPVSWAQLEDEAWACPPIGPPSARGGVQCVLDGSPGQRPWQTDPKLMSFGFIRTWNAGGEGSVRAQRSQSSNTDFQLCLFMLRNIILNLQFTADW